MDAVTQMQSRCENLITRFGCNESAFDTLKSLQKELENKFSLDEIIYHLNSQSDNKLEIKSIDELFQYLKDKNSDLSIPFLKYLSASKDQEFLKQLAMTLENIIHSTIKTIKVVRLKLTQDSSTFRLVILAKQTTTQRPLIMTAQLPSITPWDEIDFRELAEEEILTNPKRIYVYQMNISKDEWNQRILSNMFPSQEIYDPKLVTLLQGSDSHPAIFSIELLDEMSLVQFMENIFPRRRLICQERLMEQLHIAQSITLDLLCLFKNGNYEPNLKLEDFGAYCYKERFNPPVLAFVLPKFSAQKKFSEEKEFELQRCIQELGEFYLYLLSAVSYSEADKIELLKRELLKTADEQKDEKVFMKYSPILAHSISLRGFVRNMLINSNSSQFLALAEEMDWDELFDDFQHSYECRFDRRIIALEPFSRLCVASIATKVVADKEIAHHLKPFDMELPSSERAFQISDRLTQTRDEGKFSTEFLNILRQKTEIAWEEEFDPKNLEFLGKVNDSLIFQPRGQDIGKGGPRLKLLFPNPKVAKNRLGIFLQKLDFQHENPFYDHISVSILHYQEICDMAQQIPQLPDDVKKMLADIGDKGFRAEIWKLQQKRDGPSLAAWLQNEPKILPDSKLVSGILKAAQNFFEGSNIHRNLSPENIFFSDEGSENDFNLPLNIREYSILQLEPVSDYYKDPLYINKELIRLNYKSNIYTIGKILQEIITGDTKSELLPDEDFHSVPKLVAKMLEPKAKDRMSFDQFQTIHWNESKYEFELTPNMDLTTQELSLLFRFADILVVEKVLPLVVPETIKLFRDTFKGSEFLEAVNAASKGRDNREYYEKLLPPEVLLDLETLINHLTQNQIPVYHILYRYLFRRDPSPAALDFKSRLYQTIERETVVGLQPMQLIGQGAFGYVFKQKDSGYITNTAVKLVIPRTKKDELDSMEEVKNWFGLRHPNIVHLIDRMQRKFTENELRSMFEYQMPIPKGDDDPSLAFSSTEIGEDIPLQKLLMRAAQDGFVNGWILEMELCGDTLHDWMKSCNNKTIKNQLKIIRGIIRGMKYLHLNKIMHHDLKPDNILIKKKPGKLDQFSVKIADLGLSKFIPDDNLKPSSDNMPRGNTRYQAPEILKRSGPYSLQSEIFSVGLIILEVLSPTKDNNSYPFFKARKFSSNLSTKLANCTNSEVKAFALSIENMVKEDCSLRMTCSEFLCLDFDWNALAENAILLQNIFSC